MSSAFKNFFITFVVFLLVFGFLGFKYVYPLLSGFVSFEDDEESTDVSSDGESQTENDVSYSDDAPVDEQGDIFTALIMCEDDNGEVLAAAFVDANGMTKRFVYCSIPVTAKVYSANGYEQPISYAYSANGSVSIPDSVTSITGVQTDYFISINRTSLAVLVSQMSGAYYNLITDVIYIRPKYQEIFVDGQFPEGVTEYPDDYYVFIPAGRVELTEETLTDLLAYNPKYDPNYDPNSDGPDYNENERYLEICKSLLSQFFNEQSINMRDVSKLLTVVNSARTNIRREDIELHLDTIFTYNTYQLKNCTFYPNSWENTVKYIREADGRYE